MATTTFVIDSNGRAVIDKDPDAIVDYSLDWTTWLALASDPTDAIDTILVTASDGLTVDDSDHNESIVTIWVSGGEAGTTYRLTCRIVTTGGRTDERSVYVRVLER